MFMKVCQADPAESRLNGRDVAEIDGEPLCQGADAAAAAIDARIDAVTGWTGPSTTTRSASTARRAPNWSRTSPDRTTFPEHFVPQVAVMGSASSPESAADYADRACGDVRQRLSSDGAVAE